jgi:lysozyme family protein
VNTGVAQAARFLQRSAGVEADGALGPVTMAAVLSGDTRTLVHRYLRLRERFYVRLVARDPAQGRFLRGWLSRLRDLKAQARDTLAAA